MARRINGRSATALHEFAEFEATASLRVPIKLAEEINKRGDRFFGCQWFDESQGSINVSLAAATAAGERVYYRINFTVSAGDGFTCPVPDT